MNTGTHDGSEGQDQEIETTESEETGDLADSQDSEAEGEEVENVSDDDESDEDFESEDEEDMTDEEIEQSRAAKLAGNIKDPQTGNFDWKKINAKVGSPELEKAFKQTQAMITKTSQENKKLKEEHAAASQDASKFQQLDQIFQNNPAAYQALEMALGGGGMQPGQQPQEQDPFQGFNPNDPALPLLRQLLGTVQTLQQGHVQTERQRQAEETKAVFRQGLVSAKEEFVSLVGREPDEAELRAVADKMRQTRHFEGRDFVGSLFRDQIIENARRSLNASRDTKRKLPGNPKGVISSNGMGKATSKKSIREQFYELWDSESDH
jgi:hypothetical protein